MSAPLPAAKSRIYYDVSSALETGKPMPVSVPALPHLIALELTTVCNNFCSGCANSLLSASKRERKYSIQYLQRWHEALELVAAASPKLIRLTGGEPTLHPEFPQIVACLDTKNISHALLTTARWTLHRPDKVIRAYQACKNFAGMLVSLHGATREAHHAFVDSHPKAFTETCDNIRRATGAGLDIFVNTVITAANCHQIEAIVELATSLGAKFVVFNRFLSSAPHPLEPDDRALGEAILMVEALGRQGLPCRIGNSVPQCFVANSSDVNKAGVELCEISPNGDVRPDSFAHVRFGNIFEDSLKNIWQSPQAELYRRRTTEACRNCAAFAYCRGGAKSVWARQDKLMRLPLLSFARPKTDELPNGNFLITALTSD
jgi:radical SAM protein with 4Fe4S-binding SPASM domain